MVLSTGHYVALGVDDPSSLMGSTKKGLNPFIGYLMNSIKSLENKEVSCKWERVEKERFILKVLNKIYEIRPQTLVEIEPPEMGWFNVEALDLDVDDEFDPDPEDELIIGRGKKADRLKLSDKNVRQSYGRTWQIKIEESSKVDNKINWSGYDIKLNRIVSPLESDDLIFKLNSEKLKFHRDDSEWKFWLDTDLILGKSLEINGAECKYKVIRRFNKDTFQKQYPLSQQLGNYWRVTCENKPQFACANVVEITNDLMREISIQDLDIDLQSFIHDEWDILKGNGKNEWILIYKGNAEDITLPEKFAHKSMKDMLFSCHKKQVKDKWIQLVESGEENEINPSDSILEHFFSENVLLHDSDKFEKNNQLYILKRNYEEKQLLLSYGRKDKPAFPKRSSLHLKADVFQMRNQQRSIYQLLDYPVSDHLPLLDLFKLRDEIQWPIFDNFPEEDIDWKVLTDLSFKGCDKQREFVCKALATPDFAIMSGPPGTGKTTTILELILQLTSRGKRVLLAASTHAAINNVLERLEERGHTENVHATRVGLEDRAVGLEHFVYDRQVNNWSSSLGLNEGDTRKLVMESANLVCGTTMGIHSLLRKKNGLDLERNGPPFDIMIIDECSKTTFHEFMVPARLAKRWILVGDVRQLSPFTDREQITSNLKVLDLSVKDGPAKHLSSELQEACKLLLILWPYKTRFVVPVSEKVAEKIVDEIDARLDDGDSSIVDDLRRILVISDKFDLININALYEHNVVFIEQNLLNKYREWMPNDSVILEKNWLLSAHAYRHFANNDWYFGHDYRPRGNNTYKRANEVYKECSRSLETSWADEVCWRLEREYWLRFLSGNKRRLLSYQKQLERLFPQSENATGRIYTLRNIAFPSILEALSGSGLIKRKSDGLTTLNQGFNKEERDCRHTTLSYQHRMHPDISALPRELFYSLDRKNVSLLDGDQVCNKLNWSYDRYQKHRVWLDIKGDVKGNANEKEAAAIDKELTSFIEWTKQNPKADGSFWEVAILTFYKGQEKCLREHLRKLTGDSSRHSRFEKDNVHIKLATVDFFQGQEADVVFLSMVNTQRDGFLDSPNRLNVAITRARYQLVVVGYHDYFLNRSSNELKKLAKNSLKVDVHGN
ncbi:AAA family ATPase [Methanococcoides orientis]|uniref:AAA domain-containing protein n=1 Tax=Methanococcoides orientis TaxID=2822137 RepID=UPI001E357F5B|nr:AAA domain-containing protein [Methanococcoides orientis]UGV41772.1 AAA family ATPase [Methanococcoides orientis]